MRGSVCWPGMTLALKNKRWLGPKQTWLGFPGLSIGLVESLAKQLTFYRIYFHGCWTDDRVHFHRLFGYVDQLLYWLFWGRVKL